VTGTRRLRERVIYEANDAGVATMTLDFAETGNLQDHDMVWAFDEALEPWLFMNWKRTYEYLYTRPRLTAEEALEFGLVNRVVDRETSRSRRKRSRPKSRLRPSPRCERRSSW
jgi:enoyl-CoA hydratase/carnithine racemase